MTDRICAAPDCSKPLVRREGEATSNFKSRRTCGQSCGNALPRAGRPRRYEGHAGTCRFCGAPTRVSAGGPAVSCANPACRKKAYQGAHLMDNVPWPKPSGEIVADFRGHNIVPDDVYGSLPLRPATVVMKSSSIA